MANRLMDNVYVTGSGTIVFEGSPSDRKWRGHLGQPEPPIDCPR